MFQRRTREIWKTHLLIRLNKRCCRIGGTQVLKGNALKAQMDELQFGDKSLWNVIDVQIKEGLEMKYNITTLKEHLQMQG